MATDEMYLENLEELVNEENKVVTFKWLSLNLKVHVNEAKQMLYVFVQQERNKKDNDNLNVTYFVAGLPKKCNGVTSHRCCIIEEENLSAFKETLSSVTSCHIYSVQKSALKDSNALYITDYNNMKERICSKNRYSAIKYAKAQVVSREDKQKTSSQIQPVKECVKKSVVESVKEPTKKQTAVPPLKLANGSKTVKEPKGGIGSMFAKGTKAKPADDGSKPAVKEIKKEKTDGGGKDSGNKKKSDSKGGVMSFFAKQKTVKEAKDNGVEKNETKRVDNSNDMKTVESKTAKDVKTVENKTAKDVKTKSKVRPNKGKKSIRNSESDDETKPSQKRRKRIRDDLFDSSSEEEDVDVMDEEPLPSPPRMDSSPPVPDALEKSQESEAPLQIDTPNTERRRRRKRKMVPKTFMDGEGFMVTEKVWESDSTDVSENAEEPIPKEVLKAAPEIPAAKQKKSPLKSARNQTSLMSFFKKK